MPGQLSLTTGAGYVTTEALPVVPTDIFAGHVIAGGCVSLTVTVNEQLWFPLLFPLLVQVTVVVPFGKNEPDAGEHVTVLHTPVVVGAAYVTTAPHWFASLLTVTFAGHVIPHGGVTQPGRPNTFN